MPSSRSNWLFHAIICQAYHCVVNLKFFSVSCPLLPIWIRYNHDDEDEPPELPPPLFTAEEHFKPSLEVDSSLLPSQEKEKPELTIR